MDLNLRAIIYAKYKYVVKERITSHDSQSDTERIR